jgi:methylthioribose-1-phosphate isomerase
MKDYFSVRWVDGTVMMLDQRLLPAKELYCELNTNEEISDAIRQMVIRGAPAIGIAAGFGLALTACHSEARDVEEFTHELVKAANLLRKSRPTAVNLFWAIDRILKRAKKLSDKDVDQLKNVVVSEAQKIAQEDNEMNMAMSLHGQQFIPDNANVIHHCNTGALATGGYGTALGVIRAAHEAGKRIHVFVDETRPRLQGARLTSWELKQLDIPHTVIVDGASAYFMQKERIDACLVGCDRIASNGDVANKIGTYHLALAAHIHGVPFYSVGPTSTIDISLASGVEIPIEERTDQEITQIGNEHITPLGVKVANPAFDVTPAKYITAIITNKGVAYPPYKKSLAELMK